MTPQRVRAAVVLQLLGCTIAYHCRCAGTYVRCACCLPRNLPACFPAVIAHSCQPPCHVLDPWLGRRHGPLGPHIQEIRLQLVEQVDWRTRLVSLHPMPAPHQHLHVTL